MHFQDEQDTHQIKIEVSDIGDANTDKTPNNEYLPSQQISTSTTLKGKQDNSVELQQMKNEMDQTLNILKTVF